MLARIRWHQPSLHALWKRTNPLAFCHGLWSVQSTLVDGDPGTIGPDICGNSSAQINARWEEFVRNITSVYPVVRSMGFEGLVYDNEGYCSKTCNDPGPVVFMARRQSAFDKIVGNRTMKQ